MNEIIRYIRIVLKRKWWILAVSLVSGVVAFILTLPSITTPLYRVYLEFFPVQWPTMVERKIDVEPRNFLSQFMISYDIKADIIKKYGSDVDKSTKLSIENIDKRIVFLGKNRSIIISVKHESADVAAKIAYEYVDLINKKFHEYYSQYYIDEQIKYTELKKSKLNEIDSVRRKMTELLPNGRNTAEMLVYERMLKYYMEDMEEFSKIADANGVDSRKERNFTLITSYPHPEYAEVYPNRIKIVLITVFLSLVAMTFIFIAREMLISLRNKINLN